MYKITNMMSSELFVGNTKLKSGGSSHFIQLPARAIELKDKGLIKVEEVNVFKKEEGEPVYMERPPDKDVENKIDALTDLVKGLIDKGLPVPEGVVIREVDGQSKIEFDDGFVPTKLPTGDIEEMKVNFEEQTSKDDGAASTLDKLRQMKKDSK